MVFFSIFVAIPNANSFGFPFFRFWDVLQGVNPVLYMVFVFMQMYYIFMHSRLNVNKNKILAKFGMMHVVATNACIVIRTLVKESAKEIFAYKKEDEEEVDKEGWIGRRSSYMATNMTEEDVKECQYIISFLCFKETT